MSTRSIDTLKKKEVLIVPEGSTALFSSFTLNVFGRGIEVACVSHFVPIASQFTDIDTFEVFDERMEGHPEDAVTSIVAFVEQFSPKIAVLCPQSRPVRPIT